MPPPTSSSRPPRSRRERCGAALSARLAVCVAPAPTGLVGLLASNELDLRSAAGGPVPGGRYVVGAQPEKHDPYLSISSTRLATVVVRGNGGSTEPDSLHPMSTAHFISNIWITDQDGAVICDQEFDGTEASPTFSCQLATSVTMVQSHEFCNLHGLWSGPTVTVEFEVFAARKEETTSVNGNGPAYFRVATSTPTKHDPYTVYDRDTRTGRTVVLGDGGSTTDLHPHNPSHYIEAIWSRDQHGTIVTFADLSESIRGPTTEFDLSAAVPTVTKLIPYEFCNLHGLWQGNDALGYAAIRASTSLNVRSATGGGVPGGRYEIASAPKKHEPFMKITSSRVANVVVRGNGGSTEAGGLHPQGPCHYISNIWITDQNGDVVCERLFDGSEASPTMSCQLPDSVTMAQSHEFCNLHGLWSGPMLTVADETFASGKEEMTSVSGTGPTTYNEATAIMAKHDPYIAYDRATKTGSIVVLGVDGSTVNLHPQSFPNHYVEAIWARDQHGSIVFFESLTTATAPLAVFDLSATVPPVTSLVPFEYCNLHGLWRGLNSIGFAAIRDQTTLDLGMPGPGVPGGRYEVGAAPRKHEPYMKISSSSSAHVVVRGNNGSTAAGSLHPMSSGHFISNIWVTDQDGTIICEQLFDGSEASPEMDCEIPPETDTVQSHEFCNLHGLWSGPIVTVAYEVFASGKEESTSSTGFGWTHYHAAESTPVKHDPHLVYDSTRRVGYAMVLGTNGSEQNLHPQSYPGHYVEAIWARDQHGSIVFFESLTTATAPLAVFDLSATVPPVTSLVPFEYCNLHGLWRGLNAFRDQATLNLGMPGGPTTAEPTTAEPTELPTGTPTNPGPTSEPTTEDPPQSTNNDGEDNGGNLAMVVGAVMGAVTLMMGIVIVIMCQRGQRQPVVPPTTNPAFEQPPAVTLNPMYAEQTRTADANAAADPTYAEMDYAAVGTVAPSRRRMDEDDYVEGSNQMGGLPHVGNAIRVHAPPGAPAVTTVPGHEYEYDADDHRTRGALGEGLDHGHGGYADPRDAVTKASMIGHDYRAIAPRPPRAPQCDTVGFVRDQYAGLGAHSTYNSANTEA